jgi:phage/plasmid-like protein (TIGR03299 family)
MAHEIDSLAWVGDRPWHGLGIEMGDDPSVGEAAEKSGLVWTARKEPLYRQLKNGELRPSCVQVVLRDDNDYELGYVKPGYTIYQLSDMWRLITPFVESKEAKIEVAGALRHGRRAFILLRMKKDPVDIVPGDVVRPYLLVSNSFDGTRAIHIGFTVIRVVCANTEAAALDDEYSRLLRVYHTSEVHNNMAEVAEVINLAQRNFEASSEQYRHLAASPGVDQKALKMFVQKTFFPKLEFRKSAEMKKAEEAASEVIYEKIEHLFESGRGSDMKGVRGTWWGAYNAVSEFLTHQRGRSQDVRLDSLWFGNAATTNRRALKVAMQMTAKASA